MKNNFENTIDGTDKLELVSVGFSAYEIANYWNRTVSPSVFNILVLTNQVTINKQPNLTITDDHNVAISSYFLGKVGVWPVFTS